MATSHSLPMAVALAETFDECARLKDSANRTRTMRDLPATLVWLRDLFPSAPEHEQFRAIANIVEALCLLFADLTDPTADQLLQLAEDATQTAYPHLHLKAKWYRAVAALYQATASETEPEVEKMKPILRRFADVFGAAQALNDRMWQGFAHAMMAECYRFINLGHVEHNRRRAQQYINEGVGFAPGREDARCQAILAAVASTVTTTHGRLGDTLAVLYLPGELVQGIG